MAGTTGFEPATSDVTGRRSNQTELRPRKCHADSQIVTRRRRIRQNSESKRMRRPAKPGGGPTWPVEKDAALCYRGGMQNGLIVCVTGALLLSGCAAHRATPEEAKAFIDDAEQKLLALNNDAQRADWIKDTRSEERRVGKERR